jgi:hypothetical protein
MSVKTQLASSFRDDDEVRESTVNVLNRRADYFPINYFEQHIVTAKSCSPDREPNFQIQTPRLCLTRKPFVHMTFL